MCSLKVLELEGSPSRMLLRLMGERGCNSGHLIDYLQTLDNSDALQCLKTPGTIKPPAIIFVTVKHPKLICGLSCLKGIYDSFQSETAFK